MQHCLSRMILDKLSDLNAAYLPVILLLLTLPDLTSERNGSDHMTKHSSCTNASQCKCL